MLGAKRWLIVVLLAGMAVLQAGLLGVWRFGSPALAHDVGLFAALCLLAVYAAKDAGRNRVACHPIGESEAADH
jgi:hypothetical protein